MSLLLDAPATPRSGDPIGCQTPRIISTPHYRRIETGRWTGIEDQAALDFRSPAGQEAIELAADSSLMLDPWQQLGLHHSLAEDDEGRWTSFEVVQNVTRQNGKGGYLEARQIAGVMLFGDKLVIHTAHEFKTARESFRRLDQLIEGSYALSRRVKRVLRSHGEEGFEFLNGARILFLARTGSSGRGFSGDLVIMDEAMALRAAPIGALLPIMSARRNPQLVYTCSAGIGQESEQLALLRARALANRPEPDDSLTYLEWSAELHARECPRDEDGHIVCAEHDDRADVRTWQRVNPALGIRIRVQAVRRELATMRPDLFDRERLGVGDYPAQAEETWQVIAEAAWRALRVRQSALTDPVAFSIDTTPERSWSAISVAGGTEGDGRHVEKVDHRPGTDWVIERADDLDRKWSPCVWVIDEGGPAGSLAGPLRKKLAERGRDHLVVAPKVRELTQACGQFYDRVQDGSLQHLDQAPLATALAGATKRDVGDAWLWSRRGDGVDVSPLVSATYALWGWEQYHDVEPEGAPNVW
ncbi:terminase [Streptomyces sp. NBC_00582]|uniref:terminase n=1 Tax=Streptomyces sp. NBC_00582 TaxID=2975783 RepID=UPI002E7FE6B7|nr:terminase [Streptomyces sp. NBC_00582]WUB64430.1 terminase [Streptomyces sp. NBC_00582]